MGLKNKIKGFIKERMPFVIRYVRSLKGAKNIYDGINHEIKEMLEAKKLHSLQECGFEYNTGKRLSCELSN